MFVDEVGHVVYALVDDDVHSLVGRGVGGYFGGGYCFRHLVSDCAGENVGWAAEDLEVEENGVIGMRGGQRQGNICTEEKRVSIYDALNIYQLTLENCARSDSMLFIDCRGPAIERRDFGIGVETLSKRPSYFINIRFLFSCTTGRPFH